MVIRYNKILYVFYKEIVLECNKIKMLTVTGFEPMAFGFGIQCSTNWAKQSLGFYFKCFLQYYIILFKYYILPNYSLTLSFLSAILLIIIL